MLYRSISNCPVSVQYFLRRTDKRLALLRHAKCRSNFPNFYQNHLPLSSRVIRCHHLSHIRLFNRWFQLPNFAKSEQGDGKKRFIGPQHAASAAQQSDEGGFSVQANRASCVFVRQKVFCPTKTNLPRLRSGAIRSKVADSGRNKKSQTNGENNKD